MRYLLLPVVFVMFVATPAAHAQGIKDFENFSRAIGKEVSIVDQKGLIQEGIVEKVTADDVTLRIGSTTQSFRRAEVASADRKKDERVDGAAKGALVAVVMLLIPNQGWASSADFWSTSWKVVALYSAVGYAIDAAQVHPQPLYRPAASAAPALKVSFRF